MPLSPGQVLQNRYRIISLLGQGGMGAVYRAWDNRLEVLVAIKEMPPQPDMDPRTLEQFRQQFRREATVLARLSHPHLVRVTDFFEEGGNAYLVMDFVEGQSLADLIARHGPLPEAQVLAWAGQLLDALAYCHSQGVIHRDVKPQNVIIRPDGRAVLVDFGLVKLWDPRDPRTQTVMRGMGTPEYAPPEQYGTDAAHTDHRSDLYSLGATLYHALTGQAPPMATIRIADPQQFQPLRVLAPWVSLQTESGIMRAMELSLPARWPDARTMASALGISPSGWLTAAPPPPPPPPTQTHTKVMPGAVPAAPFPQATPGVAVIPARPARRPVLLWVGLVVGILLLGGAVIGALAFSRMMMDTQARMVAATATANFQQAATARAEAVATVMGEATAQAQAATATADAIAQATAEARSATATAQAIATAIARGAATAAAQTAVAMSRATATAAARSTVTPAVRSTPTSTPRPAATATPAAPRPTATPSPPTGPTATPPSGGEPARGWLDFETERAWRRGDQPYGQFDHSSEVVHSGNFAGRLQYNFPATNDNFVVFVARPAIPIPGQPTGLSAWVYGNGSGHFLNVWILDAAGEVRAYTFGQVYHQGWQMMTAWFDDRRGWPNGHISGPDNGVLDFPVSLYGFVLDGVPDGAASSGTVYIDEVYVTTQPIPQPTPTPEPPPPPPSEPSPTPYSAVLPEPPDTGATAKAGALLALGWMLGVALVIRPPARPGRYQG